MTTAVVTSIKITLPPVHPGQRPLDECPARFQVDIIGRRFGKTTFGVRKCIKGALKTGHTFWWIGPSYSVAEIGWSMLKRIAWQINTVSPVEIREADRAVIFQNGGRIVIKSAINPDSLRGEKLGGVVFDEFPGIPEATWTEVIRPALADLQGWALFIGTPKGKDWAYNLFMKAKDRPDWAAFQIPTAITEDGTANTKVIGTNNPWMVMKNGRPDVKAAIEELEQARMEMSPEQFAQEFLADFGASQYLVYPEVNPEFHEWRGPTPEFVSYHGGKDFGGDTIGAHKSVTVIAGKTAKDELVIVACFAQSGPNIAERQMNWTLEQEMKLAEIHRQLKRPFNGITYRADKSQMVGIQFMFQSGIRVYKTKGGPDSVNEGIELVHRRLKLRPEKGSPEDSKDKPKLRPRLFWLKGVPWIEEALMSYRYPEPHNDGRVESKNPLKVDDDVVDAIRYMVEGVDRGPIGDPQQLYGPLVPRIG